MSIQCVITGCALIEGNRWVAGDLFDAGSVYIFNGNIHLDRPSTAQPLWLPIESAHYSKTLAPDDWFEKRGVFVIEKSKANLNDAASQYVGTR